MNDTEKLEMPVTNVEVQYGKSNADLPTEGNKYRVTAIVEFSGEIQDSDWITAAERFLKIVRVVPDVAELVENFEAKTFKVFETVSHEPEDLVETVEEIAKTVEG